MITCIYSVYLLYHNYIIYLNECTRGVFIVFYAKNVFIYS